MSEDENIVGGPSPSGEVHSAAKAERVREGTIHQCAPRYEIDPDSFFKGAAV